jgi:ribosomal protein S18 acetylase RimI-like enzyme
MIVRAARASDLPRVSVLAAQLVRQHHALDAQRFFIVDGVEKGYERFLGGELRRKDAIVLVAEEGDALLGYAYATLEPRDWNDLLDACGKLNDVFVDPTTRRRGVGRALLDAVRAELRGRGAPRMVLMSAWRNPDAHAFFEAAGFRRTMLEMTLELDHPGSGT